MLTPRELDDYICTLYDTRNQLRDYTLSRTSKAIKEGETARDNILTIEQLKQRQEQIKNYFLHSAGGLPESDVPLNAVITNTIKQQQYTVENIIFQSRKNQYVTGNLYIPGGASSPLPAILFLSGHEFEAKHSLYYHKICLQFLQAGFVVFAIDPIGQGERLAFREQNNQGKTFWGTREHQYFGWKCHFLGESIARYFLHDNMRAIDYLISRPEVDAERIAVTGNSGGGTQTAMLMMCEERISAAAPGTYISNRQSYTCAGGVQDAEQVWSGFTKAGFDHEDMLLAFAPKPLLVLGAKYDFFPIEGTRKTVSRSLKYWKMHNAEEQLKSVEVDSVHKYTDELVQAAIGFFQTHFHMPESGEAERVPDPIPRDKLLCTHSGQVQTSIRDSKSIQYEIEQSLNREGLLRKEVSDINTVRWLREKVFQDRIAVPFNIRRVPVGEIEGFNIEYLMWWSQQGLMNSGYLIKNKSLSKTDPGLVIAIWEGGTASTSAHWDWIRKNSDENKDIFVLNTTGTGPHRPFPIHHNNDNGFFGALHKYTDDLIWLNDSLAALRVYDITRCIDVLLELNEWENKRVDLYAHELCYIYAAIAEKIDGRVEEVFCNHSASDLESMIRGDFDPDIQELMSYVIPGILQYTDVKRK